MKIALLNVGFFLFIEANEDIGDLMGAMHGICYMGFIREVYKVFAFPEREEDFKQKYDGFLTRLRVEPIIRKCSERKNPRSINNQGAIHKMLCSAILSFKDRKDRLISPIQPNFYFRSGCGQ